MIFIGMGGNIKSPFGSPLETLQAALSLMQAEKRVKIIRRSSWYKSSPVPVSDQPWYINGIVEIDMETAFPPDLLLEFLLSVELRLGRIRKQPNAPRTVDLDILDYDGLILRRDSSLVLPHPRLHQRAFVLHPLMEICPQWRHPITRKHIKQLIRELPDDQCIEKLTNKNASSDDHQ